MATAGAVTAVTHHWEAQRKADEANAAHILKQAKEDALMYEVPADHLSFHILPASGGASGVAESLVQFAKSLNDAVLIVGSRGYGSFKRAMLSVVGLGSVSDYCVHRIPCPMIVVKSAQEAARDSDLSEAPHKVCVCVDDSDTARSALKFACSALMKPDTELHIVSVAQPVSMPLIDETSAGIAAMLAKQWEEEKETSLANAEGTCAKAIDIVTNAGVSESQVYWKALRPEGGASEVGKSLVHYCKENKITIAVVGSHGFSAFTRGMRSFVGLGSVSDYCLHNLSCVVCVIKSDVPTQDPEAAQGEAS